MHPTPSSINRNLSPLPRLLPVPAMIHDLTIKASASGITVLQDGRYKKRYTGSKYSAVDINGQLWVRSSELKKHIECQAAEGEAGKKKRKRKAVDTPAEPPAENPTLEGTPRGDTGKKILRKKEYRVNKLEVRQRLMGMLHTRKGKKELYFWTVTFPKNISDDLAYQAFNTWLTSLRQKKMLRDYLWIAERQQNGTVHFHIGIPHKMSVVAANRMMRTTLTTFSKKGLIDISVFACKRYNGVDIAKNRKTKRVTNFAIKKGAKALAVYLTKYVTKNNEPFRHLAWHNSRGYSSLFTAITFTVSEFIKAGFKEFVLARSVIQNEFFKFFPWKSDPPDLIIQHLAALNNYVQDVVDNKKLVGYE